MVFNVYVNSNPLTKYYFGKLSKYVDEAKIFTSSYKLEEYLNTMSKYF